MSHKVHIAEMRRKQRVKLVSNSPKLNLQTSGEYLSPKPVALPVSLLLLLLLEPKPTGPENIQFIKESNTIKGLSSTNLPFRKTLNTTKHSSFLFSE